VLCVLHPEQQAFIFTKMQNTQHELIPIQNRGSSEQWVDARTLHRFMTVGKDFSNWIKDYIKDFGFVEGRDFSPILAKSTGGRQAIEYSITLDMAKELAMLQRSEKGRQARQYFINSEKELRRLQTALLVSYDEVELLLKEVEKIEKDGYLWYASSQIRRLSGKASLNGYQLKIRKLVEEKKAVKVIRRNQECWFVREDGLGYLLSVNRGSVLAASIFKILQVGGTHA
jgi:phage anti-repressor protein